eukprot:365204-Chlamydomonas_euryale.AAC.2
MSRRVRFPPCGISLPPGQRAVGFSAMCDLLHVGSPPPPPGRPAVRFSAMCDSLRVRFLPCQVGLRWDSAMCDSLHVGAPWRAGAPARQVGLRWDFPP